MEPTRQDRRMTTSSDTTATNTFSTGQDLTGWLTRLGAPELADGQTYRLHLGPADSTAERSPTKVTVSIYEGGAVVAQAAEITRVSSQMAAVAAAHHAFRELP